MTPRLRKFGFAVGLAALPPILFIVLEGLLRLLSPGPDLDLVIPDPARPGYVRLNPEVALRYFPDANLTGFGQDRSFPLKKPLGTFRIITLGGSTTAGFPYFYAGAFPQILESILNDGAVENSVEVINAGLTAVNSVTVRDLIPDCLALNPDLIVIYCGHNEFYGAMGTATTFGSARSRWFTAFILKLHRLRLYQWIRKRVYRWKTPAGTLMTRVYERHTIPRQGRLFRTTIARFAANLKATLTRAAAARVPVLLATVVSNIENQPPFQSPPEALAELPAFRRLREKGIPGEQAARRLQDLRQSYPDEAHLDYLAGRVALGQGDTASAVMNLIRARDEDGIRFRAPSEINAVIRSFTGREGVTIADLDSLFFGFPQARLPGPNLFWEHVHPTLTGNGRIAAFLARKIRALLPRKFAPPGAEALNKALARVTELDRTAAELQIRILTANPPFTSSPGLTLADLRPTSLVEARARELLQGKLTYRQGHLELAAYWQAVGRPEAAVRECQALADEYPDDKTLAKALAVASMATSDRKRTYALLNDLADRLPEDPLVQKWAGIYALDAGDGTAALRWLKRARRLKDDDQIRYNLAGAWLKMGDAGRAREELNVLLARNPDYPRARELKDRLTRVP